MGRYLTVPSATLNLTTALNLQVRKLLGKAGLTHTQLFPSNMKTGRHLARFSGPGVNPLSALDPIGALQSDS